MFAAAGAILMPAPALAQANGALGIQSRASIRIQISVMPSFAIRTEGRGRTEDLSLQTNASPLRLALVSQKGRDAADRGRPELVLVVPD